MKRALVLFAHGARDPRWAAPFEAVARRIEQREPGVDVRLAFLEFMTPTLGATGDALAEADCEHVDVVPLFLGSGGHVRHDLPRLLGELTIRYPGMAWKLHPAIGEFDNVIDAMAAAASGVLAGEPPAPATRSIPPFPHPPE